MRKWFILFIISILPYVAHADAVQIGSLWYNLDESAKTAEVTSSDGDSYSGDIDIPSTFEYGGATYTVVSIGNIAFAYSSITKVELPSSLISIGESAFSECSGLNSITIPSSVSSIGNNAFWGCWNLEKVITPDLSAWCSINFENYDSNPLYHANHLYTDEDNEITNLVIPSDVTSIGSHAFLYCNGITSVSIPNSVTSIGYNAFAECNNLEKVVISDLGAWCSISFSSMDSNPLNHARHLYIGENAEITDLQIPSDLTSINAYTFVNCSNFSSITIPNSVTSVGDYAFAYCYNASFNTFPSTLTSIGKSSFFNCNGITSLSLPSGLVTIEDDAFAYCNSLKGVAFPTTLSTIGNGAFRSCQIEKLVLPASVTSIGEWAFCENRNLSSVVSRIQNPFAISESVFCSGYNSHWDSEQDKDVYTYIKSEATLYVPDNTKSTYQAKEGWNMFVEIIEGEPLEATVDGLKYMYITSTKTATVLGRADSEKRNIIIPSTIPIDNVDYNVKAIAINAFANCDIDSVKISSGVETIGKNAFNDSWRLQKLELPSTLKSIGESAFCYCSNLKKLELPASLTEIDKYAFINCNNLSTVISKIQSPFIIDNSVFASGWSYYEDGVEKYPMSSATLYVPTGTKSEYQNTDGWNMFENIAEGEPLEVTVGDLRYMYVTSSQTAIVVGRANTSISNITIPAVVPINGVNYSVKSVGTGAFRDCYIETLTITSGIETIGNYAFQNANSLRKLELPNTIVKIGQYAFADCRSLQMVSLPSSLQTIENYSFYWCDNISIIVSKAQSPIKINSVFSDYSATLYVPFGTKTVYQSADGWSNFEEIVEGEPLYATVNGLNYLYNSSTQTATVVGRYDTNMRKISIPATVPIDGTYYSVKSISTGAFRNNDIDTLTIQAGVETVGKQAFQYCSLRRIELPATITEIGNYAFYSNSYLNAVISRIEKPYKIDKSVFAYRDYDYDENGNWISEYVKSRGKLYVPEGTKSLYESAEGWSEMFSGTYEGEIQEIVYGPLKYSYLTGSGAATVIAGDYSELKEVLIPTSIPIDGVEYFVKEVGQSAFEGCSNVESVTFNSGLEVIGMNAFRECYSAIFSDMPLSVRTIGERAFMNCNRINNLNIPEGVQSIGDYAYQYCGGLVEVVIPSSVTTLGESVFAGCNSLSSISVAEGNEKYESRDCNVIIDRSSNTLLVGCKKSVIPDGVTAIGPRAFENTQIANIQIPETVKSIGYSAFQSCRYLTELVIPEGVEIINNNAFSNCERLVSIDFPSTIKDFGEWLTSNCGSLLNVVSRNEDPKDIGEYTFGEYYDNIYSRATLWVPKNKTNTYMELGGWSKFKNYEEMLGDVLTAPTINYDGHYVVMTNDPEQKANIYYSTDGSEPTILYNDTVALSNLGVIQAISKRFGSYTVDTARYEVTYVYDGVTARTASGGLLKNAFEWCGTDKIEMLDIDGQLNDEDFATIRGLSKLTVLNMAASKIENSSIPSEAFANMNLEWYVSPYNFTSVGSGIFKGCDKLAALTWNSSSIELPEDVVTDVANPNMLVYAKAQAMIPYAMKNVIVNGVANNIVLVDSAGNNNFRCPEEFLARRITYTHNYQQETKQGQTQGWETLALPFTVSKITHETKGEITPFAVEGAERPFWLYELGGNGLEKATEIRANTPYLICMPNDDAYGDEYILGGRVTFSATNATITTSGGTTVSRGDRQFVPTYQRVASSSDVYALNVNEVVGDNPVGSVFVQSLREVRPFEAYSVHSTNRARIITVSSLGGGDATGINDLIQKNAGESADGVVKVYSLSGALIKQGKREEVLRSLPKGLYIINGKKIIK